MVRHLEVDFDGLLCRFAVVWKSPQLVLKFEQLAVGAKGDLADAVHVEVELILVKVLVVFDHGHVLPQTSSKLPLPPITIRHLQLIPRTLHIIQILLRIALVSREQRYPLPRLLHPSRPQQRPRSLVVNVPILVIQIPPRVDHIGGSLDVPALLQETGFELVKIHGSGRVLDALVDERDSPGVLGGLLVEDGAEVPCPEQGGGRMDGGGVVVRKGVGGCEGGDVGIDERGQLEVDGVVLDVQWILCQHVLCCFSIATLHQVQGAEIPSQRWHPLDDFALAVSIQGRSKFVAGGREQREANPLDRIRSRIGIGQPSMVVGVGLQ
mmetsp:Transcript_29607/g.61784  ORF Transcript_29607/g.61784 Transcript_29607/m.61784 type:complete len:323 (+) Transcript_29607:927-1895(+)